MQRTDHMDPKSGFTLPEVMVVVVVVGILASAALPSLGVFKGKSDLSQAQAMLASTIRATQTQALNQRRDWTISVRSNPSSGRIEMTSYSSEATPNWNAGITLPSGINLETESISLTNGMYQVSFNYLGNLSSSSGTFRFKSNQASGQTSCVRLANLLGNLLLEQNERCYTVL